MALPKKRTSTYRKGKRRDAFAITLPDLIICTHCSEKIYPNMVCPKCGHYKGREIVDITKAETKKQEKARNENQKRPTT